MATPAMLPVPMVEARAVARAWREEMPPPLEARLVWSRLPAVTRHHSRKRRRGKKPLPTVSTRPVNRKSPSSQGFHSASASRPRRDTEHHLPNKSAGDRPQAVPGCFSV